MSLFYIWIVFTFLMGVAETDVNHYLLFCFSMFYITFIYNQIYSVKITPKYFAILILLPSLILWWILYVFNYLLSMDPLDEHLIISIIFLYFYILIYIFWESY